MIITISIDEKSLELFNRLATQFKTDRSKLLRKWIRNGTIEIQQEVYHALLMRSIDREENINVIVNKAIMKGLEAI